MKEPLQDFEKALMLIGAMTGNEAVAEMGPEKLSMRLFDWDEQRMSMAFARLEEFGFAKRIPIPDP